MTNIEPTGCYFHKAVIAFNLEADSTVRPLCLGLWNVYEGIDGGRHTCWAKPKNNINAFLLQLWFLQNQYIQTVAATSGAIYGMRSLQKTKKCWPLFLKALRSRTWFCSEGETRSAQRSTGGVSSCSLCPVCSVGKQHPPGQCKLEGWREPHVSRAGKRGAPCICGGTGCFGSNCSFLFSFSMHNLFFFS